MTNVNTWDDEVPVAPLSESAIALLSSSLSCFLVIIGSSSSSNCTVLGLAEFVIFSDWVEVDVVGSHSSVLETEGLSERKTNKNNYLIKKVVYGGIKRVS